GEFFPSLRAASAGDALANQKQIGPSNGLVIALRFALGCGKPLQCIRESLQRFKNRIAAEILEGQPDVVGMVEGVGGSGTVLELLDQLVASHFRRQSFSSPVIRRRCCSLFLL